MTRWRSQVRALYRPLPYPLPKAKFAFLPVAGSAALNCWAIPGHSGFQPAGVAMLKLPADRLPTYCLHNWNGIEHPTRSARTALACRDCRPRCGRHLSGFARLIGGWASLAATDHRSDPARADRDHAPSRPSCAEPNLRTFDCRGHYVLHDLVAYIARPGGPGPQRGPPDNAAVCRRVVGHQRARLRILVLAARCRWAGWPGSAGRSSHGCVLVPANDVTGQRRDGWIGVVAEFHRLLVLGVQHQHRIFTDRYARALP